MLNDLRYALRALINNPGFAAVSILILSLAIGCNTLLFTFFNEYAIKPLPFSGSGRHAEIAAEEAQKRRHYLWSYPDFVHLRDRNQVFEQMYAWAGAPLPLREPSPRKLKGVLASGEYFEITRPAMTLGRTFGSAEDQVPGRAVLVLSHHAWRAIFNSDPAVIGSTVHIRQTPFTIIGVTEPAFSGFDPITPDAWVPLTMRDEVIPGGAHLADSENAFLVLGGILKPGVSLARAHHSLLRTALDLNAQHPPAAAIARVMIKPRAAYATLVPELLTAVTCIFTAFGLVLLIACANLAGVLLARGAARQREIAIRLSIGASRVRLVRQLLTESVLLAFFAAAMALVLTRVSISTIQQHLFTMLLKEGYYVQPLSPDWRVYFFTTVLAFAVGIAFGLAPALQATRPDLSHNLKVTAASVPRSRPRRIREALAVAQVAASLVLLIVSGIFIRNAQRVARVSPGFDIDGLIDVRPDGAAARLIERLRGDPRFISVSRTYRTPLCGWLSFVPADAGGRVRGAGYNYIDDRFFQTLGISVVRGRSFTSEEVRAQAPVAVVSEAAARLFWPGSDPLGKTFRLLPPNHGERLSSGIFEVVGVVPDIVSGTVYQGRDPSMLYMPAAPADPRVAGVLIRARDASPATVAGLKRLCADTNGVTACEPAVVSEVAALQRFPYDLASQISSGLGILALAMTCIGLYGVIAFAVVERTREIGIRMALGATRRNVLVSILARAARTVALGIALGMPLCLVFSRIAGANFPLTVTYDGQAYFGIPLFLTLVALAAAYIPARRAMRIDPIAALRQD